MHVSDDTVEVAARDSWLAWNGDDPTKDWGLINQNLPDIAESHRGLVRAMFKVDFNVERAIEVSSNGTYEFSDLYEGGRKFHVFLGRFLKEWTAKRG